MKSKKYSSINTYILLTFSLRNILNEKYRGGKHRMKSKKIIFIVAFFIMLLIMHPNVSDATLQANGSASKGDTIGNWLINIRKMEATRRNAWIK